MLNKNHSPKNSNDKRKPSRKEAVPVPKPRRDDIFSRSRDLREDRATRQIKTTHSPQTFPHAQ